MYNFKATYIFVFVSIVSVSCSDNIKDESDSITNAEQELSNYLQKIDDLPSIPIIEDYVTLDKNEDAIDGQTKENEDIIEKSARFLSTRALKIKLPGNEARNLVEDAEEKRNSQKARKRKIRKILLPLLLILKLKTAIVLPIILSIIAFVSFKGFGLSLAALAVAGTTALKNLLEHAGSKVSYEVVPTPIGHWSRAGVPEAAVSGGIQYDY